MTAAEFSVILCTRNRSDRIPSWFERLELEELGANRAELVLVDNGSSDGSGRLLQEHAERTGLPTRFVSEPRVGLGRARNAGLLNASGRMLVFADDDAYFCRGYFHNARRIFESGSAAFLGGSIQNWSEDDHPFAGLRVTETRALLPGKLILPGKINGMNSCMLRDVFDRIGFFDPLLGAGTPFPFEDIDYFNRASIAGLAGSIAPELLVYHDHGRKSGSQELWKQRRSYAIGRGGFYLKMALLGQLEGLLFFLGHFLRRPAKHRYELLGMIQYLFYILRHTRFPRLKIDEPS